MPLISERSPRRDAVEVFQDPFSLQLHHAKRTDGVSLSVSGRATKVQVQVQHRQGHEAEDFEAFDQDHCEDSDMNGSGLHRSRPKKVVKAPVLPQRSDKRASRMLDNVMLELKNIEGSRMKEEDVSISEEEDPHELYLSSEEDASLSDDYEDSDSLLDFEDTYSEDENGASSSRPSSRRSQEITATVISFVVVKPHIVEIHSPSNHTAPVTPAEAKPEPMAMPTITMKSPSPILKPALRRPPPLNLNQARPVSMAITTTYHSPSYTPAPPTNASMTNLSLPSTSTFTPTSRKSSRLANLVSSTFTSSRSFSTNANSPTPSFLDFDPFAHSSSHPNPPLTPTDLLPLTAPRIPTSQSSAWKKTISRTLSKAHKPSMQKINQAYNTSLPASSTSAFASSPNTRASSVSSASAISPLTRTSSNPEPTTPKLPSHSHDTRESIIEMPVRRAETMPVTPSPREVPAFFKDLMRGRVPPPIPETSQQELRQRESRKSFGLGMGRRKSLKR